MPVYIPSFAPFAPAPNINAVPSNAIQGISGGQALGNLAASGAAGIRERQTLEQLAGSVDNPQVAEILRSQKTAVPLFGTPGYSPGGGRGSRGGGSGVSGEAIGFALNMVRDEAQHAQTLERDKLQYGYSRGLEELRFGNRRDLAEYEQGQLNQRHSESIEARKDADELRRQFYADQAAQDRAADDRKENKRAWLEFMKTAVEAEASIAEANAELEEREANLWSGSDGLSRATRFLISEGVNIDQEMLRDGVSPLDRDDWVRNRAAGMWKSAKDENAGVDNMAGATPRIQREAMDAYLNRSKQGQP